MDQVDSVAAVVLAAGKGTRMGSDRAKVLHTLCGRPLLGYPIAAAREAGASRVVVVVGHQQRAVRSWVLDAFADPDETIGFAEQTEQRGTGHAVQCALPALGSVSGAVLILSGDVPQIRAESLRRLVAELGVSTSGIVAATFTPDDPTGYGRMIRDANGSVQCIREHRDATAAERAVTECNAGIYAVMADVLRQDLPRLGSANTQGEVYLTDLIELGARRGPVGTVPLAVHEAAGINTAEQLAAMEASMKAASDPSSG